MAIDENQPSMKLRSEQTRHVFRKIVAAFFVGWVAAVCGGFVSMRTAYCVAESAPVERINPNTAPPASLMRLPGIGRVRAMDILAGRKELPFDSADDLERVRGIGPKTVEKMAPYLTFEEQSIIKGVE
jgi:DNA uptake protein ComE-like DNA-binding protein